MVDWEARGQPDGQVFANAIGGAAVYTFPPRITHNSEIMNIRERVRERERITYTNANALVDTPYWDCTESIQSV